eukprot:711752-Hanusia_phi.AAC.1
MTDSESRGRDRARGPPISTVQPRPSARRPGPGRRPSRRASHSDLWALRAWQCGAARPRGTRCGWEAGYRCPISPRTAFYRSPDVLLNQERYETHRGGRFTLSLLASLGRPGSGPPGITDVLLSLLRQFESFRISPIAPELTAPDLKKKH